MKKWYSYCHQKTTMQSDLAKLPEAITPKPLSRSSLNLHSVIRKLAHPDYPLNNFLSKSEMYDEAVILII